MANSPFVTLHGVDFILPDGTALFQGLDESFGSEAVGLIGRNGSGKSSLGKLVSGALQPSSGRIERAARVIRIDQQAGPVSASSLAQLAGLDAPLAALRRLVNGDGRLDDIDLVADQWDIEARWQSMLERAGLSESWAPAALSGGQRMLLALIGGFCSDADLLVLDEPGNHLDRDHRHFLSDEIARWRASGRGLLLITHDRALLADVDRTLETTPPALRRYGGGWACFEQQRAAEIEAASARLDRAKTERRRQQAAMRQQLERDTRKNAKGARDRHTGSQGKLLLDAMQDRAERSSGALAERHALRHDELQREVLEAFEALGGALERPAFPVPQASAIALGQTSLAIEDLVAPWAWTRPFTWTAHGPARICIRGPNGCGKSTLLKLIAGRIKAASGHVRTLECALIDQTLAPLDHSLPVLQQLQARATGCSEGKLRQYLAQAGIGNGRLIQAAGTLSGGEQMRAALLLAVLGDPPARVLLLDEPTNHLDLAATEALEAMLESWTGALVVVSHDETFLGKLRLTHAVDRSGDGWTVQDWQPTSAVSRPQGVFRA